MDSNHTFLLAKTYDLDGNSTNLTTFTRAAINVATQPWFIGMMVSIALLLIILINVCVLVKERGGKYSVQEKEPFQNQMLTDGQGFDEYQKNIGGEGMSHRGGMIGRGGGIQSGDDSTGAQLSNIYYDEKQFHDEDDSMAEYGNGENGKFNEDGSFIGLYGRDRIQTYVVQYNKDQVDQQAAAGTGTAVAAEQAADPNEDPSKRYSTFV